MRVAGFLSLAAATMPSPRGPQPATTTVSLNCTDPSSTACTEHASGSMKAACHAGILRGTWEHIQQTQRDNKTLMMNLVVKCSFWNSAKAPMYTLCSTCLAVYKHTDLCRSDASHTHDEEYLITN